MNYASRRFGLKTKEELNMQWPTAKGVVPRLWREENAITVLSSYFSLSEHQPLGSF